MKLTKKLIPSLGMLVLSACMLVTSTFAWFAMNDVVKATNMTVTAKGDQVYLQIITDETKTVTDPETQETSTVLKGFTDGALATEVSARTPSATLLPVNVVKSIKAPVVENQGEENEKTTYGCNPYTGGKDFIWVTAIGTSNSDGAPSSNYAELDAGFDSYYLKNTFYIRLDPTAASEDKIANNPLTISGISVVDTQPDTDPDDEETPDPDVFMKSLSVFVVCTISETDDEGQPKETVQGQLWQFDENGDFVKTAGDNNLSKNNFSVKDTSAKVEIYVFFNGDSEYCTLANLAAAANAGYKVDVTFTVA